MSSQWYSRNTLPREVPRTSFEVAYRWKKPLLVDYESVLIQELIFISKLPVCHRHMKVLLLRRNLAKCGYLEGCPLETSGIEDLDPFALDNLEDFVWDLALDNERNRLIQESLMKTICHMVDVPLGEDVPNMMPTLADLERLNNTKPLMVKGIIK